MRAVVCHEFGAPDTLRIEDIPEPEPDPNQVLLQVLACAITFPDVLKIADAYQTHATLPFIPGSNIVGRVMKAGNDVTSLPAGAKVIASTQYGGLAEFVAVDQDYCSPIPEEIDASIASGLLYAYGTSQYALVNRAKLQAGESLVVLGGAGAVGLAAVELGSLLGAHVIAVASSEERLAICRDRGAAATINYREEDLKKRIRELTSEHGADVIYDAIGGPYAESALRSIAWNGRFLVVGFASGEIPSLRMNLPLLKGCQVIGVYWGAFRDKEPELHRQNVEQLVELLRTGSISPRVSAVYPLEGVAQAFGDVTERRAIGKVVVVP